MTRWSIVCALAALGAAPQLAPAQPGELIERTLALVGGQVITLGDVRTATALGLVEADAVTDTATVTARLVDRLLMLREVERYAAIEPPPRDIDERLRTVVARAGGHDRLAGVLAAGGVSEPTLRAWIRDDLRIASYLEQRFSPAVALPGAAGEDRDQLAGERRAALIADWIADLRRRTPIVDLTRQ
jgi:hypothetical protein